MTKQKSGRFEKNVFGLELLGSSCIFLWYYVPRMKKITKESAKKIIQRGKKQENCF